MNARERIIEFFYRNPTEELTQYDAHVKFGICQPHASVELNALVKERALARHLIENEHGGGVFVYHLPQWALGDPDLILAP